MRKNPFYLVALALVMSLTACDKNTPEEKEISLDPKDAPVLIKNSTAFQETPDYTIDQTIDNTYDDNNFLIGEDIALVVNFPNGSKLNINMESNYQYDELNRLSEINTTGDNREKQIYTYEGNIQTMIYSYHTGEAFVQYQKVVNELDENAQIIKQQYYGFDDYDEVWEEMIDTEFHEWKDNNIEHSYSESSFKSAHASLIRLPRNVKLPQLKIAAINERTTETTYAYRTEISPLAYSSVKTGAFPLYYSKNLIASHETLAVDSSFSNITVYTYEMNDENYPSSVREAFSHNKFENGSIKPIQTILLDIDYEYIYIDRQ